MKRSNNKRTYYLGMLINMILYPYEWTTSKKETFKYFIKGGKWNES